ncbi:MAG: hypothetical protein R2911_09475 [Caldilineaceae bacterium]
MQAAAMVRCRCYKGIGCWWVRPRAVWLIARTPLPPPNPGGLEECVFAEIRQPGRALDRL